MRRTDGGGGKVVFERRDRKISVAKKVLMQGAQGGGRGVGRGRQAVLEAYYEPTDREDCTLVFESRFESGNLQRASKVCGVHVLYGVHGICGISCLNDLYDIYCM